MTGLSKSALEVFKDCPKCFWLDKNQKLKRPDGIKASIMDGIDECMKGTANHSVREQKQHKYLVSVPGAVPHPNRKLVESFMSWRTFQATVKAGPHTVLIWGQVDDLIMWPDGTVSAWDFKSNGKKRDWSSYTLQYNSLQGDMYAILLGAQQLKVTKEAYFTYAWPIVDSSGDMGFQHETVSIDTDPARALKVIEAAVDCLMGPMPKHSPGCNYCTYVHQREGI